MLHANRPKQDVRLDRAAFGSGADAPRHPYSLQAPRALIAVEWLSAFVIFATIAAPRGTAAIMAIWALLAWALLGRPSMMGAQMRAPGRWIAGLGLAIVAWAAVSSIWSPVPVETFSKAAQVAGLVAFACLFHLGLGRLTAEARWHLARGLVHGGAAALIYLLIERETGGAIKSWLMNNSDILATDSRFNIISDGAVVGIEETFLNRHIVVAALWVWPLALCGWVWLGGRRGRAVFLVGLLGLTAGLALGLQSETAKVMLVAGLAIAGLAAVQLKLARRLLLVGWVGYALAGPLFVRAVLPDESAFRNVLPFSARHRIDIWKTTADYVAERPVLGFGGYATQTLSDERDPAQYVPGQPHISRHAHNNFLQIWLELGVVGAALMAAIGAALVTAAATLPVRAQPFVLGWMASLAVCVSVGFGVWQIWLLSAYVVTGLILVAVVKQARPEAQVDPEETSAPASAGASDQTDLTKPV